MFTIIFKLPSRANGEGGFDFGVDENGLWYSKESGGEYRTEMQNTKTPSVMYSVHGHVDVIRESRVNHIEPKRIKENQSKQEGRIKESKKRMVCVAELI